MPIFMDRHDIQGITAKVVAEIHQADLKVQGKYGCKTLTYWFDEKSGLAFCLIDDPEKEAIIGMHKEAHGGVPNQVINVESNLVQTFLGRITYPKVPDSSSEPDLIINETAIRTIMYIEFKRTGIRLSKFREEKPGKSLNDYNELIHQTMKQRGCRKIKDTDDGYIASFISGPDALKCAEEILNNFNEHNRENPGREIDAAIGISTGAPVTGNDEFFGETIQQAKRLSYIAGKGEIFVSSSLNILNANKTFTKTLKPDEEKFLNQLLDITEKYWNRSELNVNDFCKQIGVSKSQLYRKTTSLTGYSPNEFIREFRLKKALKLIEHRRGNISEIAFESGFSNPSYFTQCFHKRFGILPSEYESFVS
ncbi:MAG: hypothetical protein A2000_05540 [Ignavibacteria bacterium GWB2_36_8]|nr:MAG: hypothetical protein A2000_05540 [Ignavibacteria bacterium GWB2_36_8]